MAVALKRPYPRSKKAYQEASAVLVGGVNSPVRSFRAVGSHPIFFEKGKGAYLYDIDRNKYIDYCQSWGSLIMGHSPKILQTTLAEQSRKGSSFGTATPWEINLAQILKKALSSCDQFRFVNSGTEAAMTAIRLARAITGRSKIIKFEGCYHGHSDALLVKAGSGLATLGQPSSAGVTKSSSRDTIILPYNDETLLQKAFEQWSHQISCIILEPVAANMGIIPAKKSFLRLARQLTRKNKSLLIFDEVISGFRVGESGAQGYYGIKPDITLLGKIVGGGLPVGVVGGPKKWMRYLSPLGPVYQAGTLSGNPLAMKCGYAVLKHILKQGYYARLQKYTLQLTEELKKSFATNDIPAEITVIGSMFAIFFQQNRPLCFSDISDSHVKIYRKFFRHMLDHGIYFPPSAYEAFFVSDQHRKQEIKITIAAAKKFRF